MVPPRPQPLILIATIRRGKDTAHVWHGSRHRSRRGQGVDGGDGPAFGQPRETRADGPDAGEQCRRHACRHRGQVRQAGVHSHSGERRADGAKKDSRRHGDEGDNSELLLYGRAPAAAGACAVTARPRKRQRRTRRGAVRGLGAWPLGGCLTHRATGIKRGPTGRGRSITPTRCGAPSLGRDEGALP